MSTPSDKLLIEAFAKIDKLALGVAVGVVSGLGVFLCTAILIAKGGEPIGPNLALLGQYFVGYTVTPVGAFIGLVYGALLGFFLGYLGAALRNGFIAVYTAGVRARQELPSLRSFLDHF